MNSYFSQCKGGNRGVPYSSVQRLCYLTYLLTQWKTVWYRNHGLKLFRLLKIKAEKTCGGCHNTVKEK